MSIFKISEVKKQIKRAGKNTLIYDKKNGIVSNSQWAIKYDDDMLSALLDVTPLLLNGGQVYRGVYKEDAQDLSKAVMLQNFCAAKRTQIIIDHTVYTCRLYTANNKPIYIQSEYDSMLDPEWRDKGIYDFMTVEGKEGPAPIYFIMGNDVQGVIMPLRVSEDYFEDVRELLNCPNKKSA